MGTIGVIPASLAERLASPHVVYALLAKLDFDTGTYRLHNGVGTITAGGFDWLGVTDPGLTRLLSMGAIQLPEVNVAAAVQLTLSGVDLAMLRALRADYTEAEGRGAVLYFLPFDVDTNQPVGDPIEWFPGGTMTAPTIKWGGIGVRTVSIMIEGVFSAKNYTIGGAFSDADQKRRYPGDRGCEFIGSEVTVQWPPL